MSSLWAVIIHLFKLLCNGKDIYHHTVRHAWMPSILITSFKSLFKFHSLSISASVIQSTIAVGENKTLDFLSSPVGKNVTPHLCAASLSLQTSKKEKCSVVWVNKPAMSVFHFLSLISSVSFPLSPSHLLPWLFSFFSSHTLPPNPTVFLLPVALK